MSSIISFKVLNNHLKPLCFSPSLRLKSLAFFAFSKRRTNSFLCLSQSRIVSPLHSKPTMETVKEVTKQGSAAHDSLAIKADGKSYTYRQLVASATRISSLLCNADPNNIHKASQFGSPFTSVGGVHGHGHLGGARVGIVAKPSAEFVAGILGSWLSGCIPVPLALSYPEDELVHVISDSEISMILSTEDYQEVMQDVAVKTASQVSLIPHVPSINPLESTVDQLQIDEVVANKVLHRDKSYSSEDPALIIYTSGTTGKPKGVVHTHKSVSAQVQTLAEAWEYTSADRFLHCLPLHHVHGLFNALLAPLYAGSMVEFMPKFSVRGIWQRWRESYPKNGMKGDDGITVFTGVPTMYTWLIQGYRDMDPELKDSSAFAARQLRLMMCGSSALPLPVMQEWETITGHRLLERYGMTEFVMAISNPLKGDKRKAGTVGIPFPGVEVKIGSEDESGSDQMGMGELCVRSPSLFKEYWKRPEVTKDSFTEDGFFKTGDTGKVDEDGYYIILGRTSADIMKVGGYKLSALEIESVLLEHPVIAECCVLGLPDKYYGEAVTAIIVVETETKRKSEEESKPPISLEELCNWAKEKLAPYKLPTRMLLYDSLPRNAMGKINKKELKKKLASEQQHWFKNL